jgi:predicted dehydrogenase
VNAGALPSDHWTRDQTVGGGRIVGEACHFIDLCRFFVGSPIATLQIVSGRDAKGEPVDDIALFQLAFADGSIATIQYFSSGNRSFPKERVELSFDAKMIRLDNFRRVEAWGVPGISVRWPQTPDKGHDSLVTAFIMAIRSGGPAPISYEELLEVGFFAIEAERLVREGGGVVQMRDFESQIRQT